MFAMQLSKKAEDKYLELVGGAYKEESGWDVGKEENETWPEKSALSYHRWSCVGGLKKYFQDLTHHT